MEYEKQISRFLKRKEVMKILGDNYKLSPNQHFRLCKLFDKYKTPKNMENMLTTIAYFILYDLNNYIGRYNRLIGKNGTSTYSQMLRYGRNWKDIYENQSNKKSLHFKNKVEYWLKNGYSLEEAKKAVNKIQKERSDKASKKLKGSSLYTVRSVDYWTNIGFTIEEAKQKVKLIQTTNGLEFYKLKYPDNYLEMYNDRIERWTKSYNENDMQLVNLKKSQSIAGGLARGLSYDDAVNSYNNCVYHMKKIKKLPSKISQDLFDLLFDKIGGTCYYSSKNKEKNINGFNVDFFHEQTKVVIEFYGDFYHRNPDIYQSNYIAHGITSVEKWNYDRIRIENISQSDEVSKVLIVWETDYRKNPNGVLEYLYGEMT